MSLSEIKSIKPAVVELLEADEWTVGKLSTTTAPGLVKYKGIGLKLAGKIIEEARALVNAGWQETTGDLIGPVVPAPPVEVQMSPRVRRAVTSSGVTSD